MKLQIPFKKSDTEGGTWSNKYALASSIRLAKASVHCTHHLQYGWVAADDEGQAAEALDAVGNAHRQLLV